MIYLTELLYLNYKIIFLILISGSLMFFVILELFILELFSIRYNHFESPKLFLITTGLTLHETPELFVKNRPSNSCFFAAAFFLPIAIAQLSHNLFPVN